MHRLLQAQIRPPHLFVVGVEEVASRAPEAAEAGPPIVAEAVSVVLAVAMPPLSTHSPRTPHLSRCPPPSRPRGAMFLPSPLARLHLMLPLSPTLPTRTTIKAHGVVLSHRTRPRSLHLKAQKAPKVLLRRRGPACSRSLSLHRFPLFQSSFLSLPPPRLHPSLQLLPQNQSSLKSLCLKFLRRLSSKSRRHWNLLLLLLKKRS